MNFIRDGYPHLICRGFLENVASKLEKIAGADPGEVKRVNFHPPFSESPSFFFFLSLKYWLVLIHYYKNSPPISKSWIRACSLNVLFAFIWLLITLILLSKYSIMVGAKFKLKVITVDYQSTNGAKKGSVLGCVPLGWSEFGSVIQDLSGSVWIIVHQRNQWIHDQSGFTGSFDAPWSRQI